MTDIYMGCAASLGQGGLGNHLKFIVESAQLHTGKMPHTYSIGGSCDERITPIRPHPPWMPIYNLSPLRWVPSMHVLAQHRDFDREVQTQLPHTRIVYHSFPGCAERSFRTVHSYGGIAILEAATTHVESLCLEVAREHRRYRMGGSPFSERWKRQVLREYQLADYVVVSSELQKETFVSRGYPIGKILVAPLGIDTRKFSLVPGQISMSPREHGQKFRIIQVGQVSLLKGFQYVLEALKLLKDPEIELVLLGGIGWRGIRRLIEGYRREGVQVTTSSGNPIPWFHSSHVCVHASIQDGFGLAPLESMSCGLPVIVTNSTGMQDAVINASNGYIVNSRDVGQLAERIQYLKVSDDTRINMAHRARETALGYDLRVTMRNYAHKMERIWQSQHLAGGNQTCQA